MKMLIPIHNYGKDFPVIKIPGTPVSVRDLKPVLTHPTIPEYGGKNTGFPIFLFKRGMMQNV